MKIFGQVTTYFRTGPLSLLAVAVFRKTVGALWVLAGFAGD